MAAGVTVIEQLLADAASIQWAQDLPNAETEALRRFVAAETEALRQFVAAIVPNDADPSTEITLRAPVGHPVASVILDTAHSEAADLIVMGTHGLGGFRKWLLGSTTERLLRRTDVPVLIVPPTGEPPGVRRADGKLELSRIVAATDLGQSSKHAINLSRPANHYTISSEPLPAHAHNCWSWAHGAQVAFAICFSGVSPRAR